ncbi:MAG: hypothetical protein AB1629_01905 [Candidatus Omnitrophota bacterium]
MNKKLSILFLLNILFFLTPKLVFAEQIAEISGKILPDQTIVHQFLVDPASQLRIRVSVTSGLLSFGPSFGFDLGKVKVVFILPDGRRIDPTDLSSDYSIRIEKITAKGKGMKSHTLVFDRPISGLWRIELNLAKGEKITNYSINISSEKPDYMLQVPPIQLIRLGEPVRIEVRLRKHGQPCLKASVTGKSSSFNTNKEQELIFKDNALDGDLVLDDGIYTATLKFDRPDQYTIYINATDTKTFQRIGWTQVYASKQTACLTGKVREVAADVDNNGKFEALNILVEVEVFDTQGSYSLSGFLNNASGQFIGLSSNLDPRAQAMMPIVSAQIPKTIGVHEVGISFPGNWFLESKLDGSYLARIDLEDDVVGPGRPIQSLKRPYQTKPYHWKDFQAK